MAHLCRRATEVGLGSEVTENSTRHIFHFVIADYLLQTVSEERLQIGYGVLSLLGGERLWFIVPCVLICVVLRPRLIIRVSTEGK